MLTSIRICSTDLLNYAQGPIDTHQEIISGYVWREFWLHQWNLLERTCFMSPCHTSIEKCNSSIFMPYELIKMSDRYFKIFNIIELGSIRSLYQIYAHMPTSWKPRQMLQLKGTSDAIESTSGLPALSGAFGVTNYQDSIHTHAT